MWRFNTKSWGYMNICTYVLFLKGPSSRSHLQNIFMIWFYVYIQYWTVYSAAQDVLLQVRRLKMIWRLLQYRLTCQKFFIHANLYFIISLHAIFFCSTHKSAKIIIDHFAIVAKDGLFFQNIGFHMVPSDPFMSHLATQLGYSAVEFPALQLIVLATFGVVD